MTVWLLTWLWQGLALTFAVALVLALGQRVMNAATRHAIWWSVLAGVIWLAYASNGGLTPFATNYVNRSDLSAAPEAIFQAPDVAPLFVSVFLGVWIAIALMRLVRIVPGLRAVFALRDRCRPVPAHVESQLPLWLESKGYGRPAQLAICDSVSGATVLGFDRPCIALPSALIAALNADELDQIVLHEHAHVQRRDDWARLAQQLIEAVLWIHPAVAMIGRALNREREMACDEWVVARTNSPKLYARCLARAAEVRGRIPPPALASALLGQHDLIRRVDRLLALKGSVRRRVSGLSAAAAAYLIATASVQLNAVPLVGAYVETLLPDIAAPVAPMAGVASPVDVPDTMSPLAPIRANLMTASQSREEQAPTALVPDGPAVTPAATRSEEPQHATRAPEPIVLPGQVFHGSYASQSNAASADAPNPWRATAVPGVAIAGAAKKTAVGMANVFTRAGVSLAKSF